MLCWFQFLSCWEPDGVLTLKGAYTQKQHYKTNNYSKIQNLNYSFFQIINRQHVYLK